MLKYWLCSSTALIVVGLGASGGGNTDTDATVARLADPAPVPGVVDISEEELQKAGVRIESAQPGTLVNSIETIGRIVMNPDRIVHVVPLVKGVATKVQYRVGDNVKAGATLAVLHSHDLAEARSEYLTKFHHLHLAETDYQRARLMAESADEILKQLDKNPAVESLRSPNQSALGNPGKELLTAYTELVTAEAFWNRQSSLREQELTSATKLEDARSRYEKARATLAAARDEVKFHTNRILDASRRALQTEQVALEHARHHLEALGLTGNEIQALADGESAKAAQYELTSSIDGTVIHRHLAIGEVVTPDQQPFTIADLSTVWGQLVVFHGDLSKVHAGQSVSIDVDDGQGAFEGTIEYITPTIDPDSRSATARVVLNNADGRFRPGQFLQATITVNQTNVPLLAPRSALQTIDGQPHVFVKTDTGLQAEMVTLGRGNDRFVEIVAGLTEGQRFASDGTFLLKADLLKELAAEE